MISHHLSRILLLVVPSLVLYPTLASAVDRRTEEIIVVSSAAADIVMTEFVLSRGFTERNPVAGNNRLQRVALKSVTTAGVIYLARFFERRDHPKMARAIRITTAAVNLTAVGWNASLTISF